MPDFLRLAGFFLLCVVVSVGAAWGAPQEAAPAATEVMISVRGSEQAPRLVAPGEWLPYGCSLAAPYRGGSVLRYEIQKSGFLVSVDGGASVPAWIRLRQPDDLAALNRELERGTRGFAVLCPSSELPNLPPLPRGRDIALAVMGHLEDFAPLMKHRGVSALSLYSKTLTDLGPLADFPELTSLRLTGCPAVSDLRPLAKLDKLTWLALRGVPNLEDLSPLAGLSALRGLDIRSCRGISDLGPLAGATNLNVLKLPYAAAVTDAAPLAKLVNLNVLNLSRTGITDLGPLAGLAKLVELDLSGCDNIEDLQPLGDLGQLRRVRLSGCKGVKDLTPLRHVIRRGGKVEVSGDLRPLLQALSNQN